jgi:hypothetical protein
MTVGDGIFWSTVLILFAAAVYHISIRNKWKVVGKTIGVFLVIGAMGTGAIWGYFSYKNRPTPTTELNGVRLGMTPLEVRLAKGAPTTEEEAKGEKEDEKVKLGWQFRGELGDESTVVIFYGSTTDTMKVAIVCARGGYSTLLGLGRHSNEKDVIKKLGQPSTVSISKDGLSKIMSFESFKVAYELTKGQVTELCVTESGGVNYVEQYQQKDTQPK